MAPARRRPPERARPPMSVRPARSASLLVAAACAAVVPARAQDLGPGPHAYVLDIATATEKGPYAPWGLGDLARLRLMAAPTVGPLQLDAAWEQSLSWSQQPGGATGPFGSAVAGVGGDWLLPAHRQGFAGHHHNVASAPLLPHPVQRGPHPLSERDFASCLLQARSAVRSCLRRAARNSRYIPLM